MINIGIQDPVITVLKMNFKIFKVQETGESLKKTFYAYYCMKKIVIYIYILIVGLFHIYADICVKRLNACKLILRCKLGVLNYKLKNLMCSYYYNKNW